MIDPLAMLVIWIIGFGFGAIVMYFILIVKYTHPDWITSHTLDVRLDKADREFLGDILIKLENKGTLSNTITDPEYNTVDWFSLQPSQYIRIMIKYIYNCLRFPHTRRKNLKMQLEHEGLERLAAVGEALYKKQQEEEEFNPW